MSRTRVQAKIAVASGAKASLLRLPVETRLQIYGIVLPVDFSGGDEGRASDKPDDAADSDAADSDAVDSDAVDSDAAPEESYNEACRSLSLNHDRRWKPLPGIQQPTYDNRQAYGQLLLACKMIHAEAAPLFYSRVTFFVKEPFKFANTFLRRLPAHKITSIRHLELRLSLWDFRYVGPKAKSIVPDKARSKVLDDLIPVFKTYRELSHLDSLTLTMHGRLLFTWNRPTFHPVEEGYELYYTFEGIMSCMSKAGRALADTIGLNISENVEDIFGENTPVKNIIPGIAVVRVKLQRKE